MANASKCKQLHNSLFGKIGILLRTSDRKDDGQSSAFAIVGVGSKRSFFVLHSTTILKIFFHVTDFVFYTLWYFHLSPTSPMLKPLGYPHLTVVTNSVEQVALIVLIILFFKLKPWIWLERDNEALSFLWCLSLTAISRNS
jgi:hypothetical protein